MLDIKNIRSQFPILNREVNGKPLLYFDNGATVQKTQSVINAVTEYYTNLNANVHRGVHTLSNLATEALELTRYEVQRFINAVSHREVIFTKGTTESINLIAQGFTQLLQKGDEVVISTMEHHSNIVPWQMLCKRTGAVLKIIKIDKQGVLDLNHYKTLLSDKTKIVAVTHASNTLGTVNPVKVIIQEANKVGAVTLIDGAQAAAHIAVDVQDLNCDFYVFSAHKMYAPTGVGVLYGKEEWLEKLPPYQGGGEMIKTVTFKETTYADLPFKFEAGTPNIASIVGFKQAIDFLTALDLEQIAQYEHELLNYATGKLKNIEGLKIIGEAPEKSAIISFVIDGIHPFDVGSVIDKFGVAVRTGHHCTQPLMQFFEISGTIRLSFAVYNTIQEIDLFIAALDKTLMMLR